MLATRVVLARPSSRSCAELLRQGSRGSRWLQPTSTRPTWAKSVYHTTFCRRNIITLACIRNDGASISDGKKRGMSTKAAKLEPVSTISEERAREELVRLNQDINFHDELYYAAGEEVREDVVSGAISDRAYDKLVQRAELLTGKFDNLRTLVDKFERVGYKRSNKFAPFTHTQSMLSLANAFSSDDLRDFVSRCHTKLGIKKDDFQGNETLPDTIVMEPKIDGLSLALHYRGGRLVGAGTRGDGVTGEDVLCNARLITDLPQELSQMDSFEVRGEVYISKSDFAALNIERGARNETAFSTARNAAAGGLRQLDATLMKGRKLRFFAYSLFSLEERDDGTFSSSAVFDQSKALETLRSLGFRTADPVQRGCTFTEVVEHCHRMETLRSSLEYDVDGVVLKVDSISKQETIGQLSRFPSWAIAYKFKAEEAVTVLRDIEVQVGRTGVLTPVALLEPVEVGGVSIERATLHNQAEVRKLALRPGARVKLIRAGDVIPKIIGRIWGECGEAEVEEDASLYTLPDACPVCGSPTQVEGEGKVLVRCTGSAACPAQVISTIGHFCGRDAADIDGLGLSRIKELHSLGLIKSVADIYMLRKADLRTIANTEDLSLRNRKGWGDRSVNNLLSAIDQRRSLTFERFLYGLGVRHIGQEISKDIASFFGDFGSLWKYVRNEAVKDKELDDRGARLLLITGVGPKAVNSLLQFVTIAANVDAVERLLQEVEVLPAAATTAEQISGDTRKLSQEMFLFTGKLTTMSRTDAKRACVALGAKVGSAFTKDTTVLVNAGDRESSKVQKARERGVRIIDEDTFLAFIGRNP